MIVGIRAFQDTGKTALGVGIIKHLCLHCGYSFNEVIANISLKFPVKEKPLSLNNAQIKSYVRNMVSKGIEHKVIFLDEADRLFPARFWAQHGQSEALIGLWQDRKLFNYIIYTAHEGTGVDIILREVTQIELVPNYVESENKIYFKVYNGIKGKKYRDSLLNVRENIFPYYDRWEVVN